ncbi:hypothetical protein [Enterococcus olivae]
MKKKQLAKLKQQFRPSFETTRRMVFDSMKKQALEKYNLAIHVFIKATNQNEMAIELLGETTRDQVITVPLDEQFDLVIKRIQRQENNLLERFSGNLVEEVASYWLPNTPTQTTETTEVVEETEEKIEEKTEITESRAFDTFKEKIEAFPKFHAVKEEDKVVVFEKTAKEDRLLATISMKEEASFVIESALERKYKLKLEVIPVIEAFAQTPISER